MKIGATPEGDPMGLKDPWWMKHCADAEALSALSEDPKKLRKAIKASRGFVLEKLVEAGLEPDPNALAKMDLPACAMHLKTRRWDALTAESKAAMGKWLIESESEPRGAEEVKAAYFKGAPIREDEDLDPEWIAAAPEMAEKMFDEDEYSARKVLERMASKMSADEFLGLPQVFLDQNAWLFSERPEGIVDAGMKAAYLRALERDRSRAGKPKLNDFRSWRFEPGEKGLIEALLADWPGRQLNWSDFSKLQGASKLFEPAEYVAVWAPTKLSGLAPEVLAANKEALQEALAEAARKAGTEWDVGFFLKVDASKGEFEAICDDGFWEKLSARSFPSFSGGWWREDEEERSRLWAAAIGAARSWVEGKASGPSGGAAGGAVRGALGWAARMDRIAEAAGEEGASEISETCAKLADALFEGPLQDQMSTGHSMFWEALADGAGYLEAMAESERGRERIARFSAARPSGNWLWVVEGALARAPAREGFMASRKSEALDFAARACRERLDPELVREAGSGRKGELAQAQGARSGRCGQEGWEGLFLRWSPERSPGCWPLMRRIEEAGGDLAARFEEAGVEPPEELVAGWLSDGSSSGADKALRAEARSPGLLSKGRLAALARDHEEAGRLGAADSGAEEARLSAELAAAADEASRLRRRVDSGSRAARRHQGAWPKAAGRVGELASAMSLRAVAECAEKMLSDRRWGDFLELTRCGRPRAAERLDSLFRRRLEAMPPEALALELEDRSSLFWEALSRSAGRGEGKRTLPSMDEAWRLRVAQALLERVRRAEDSDLDRVEAFFKEEEAAGFFKSFALANFPEAIFGNRRLYPPEEGRGESAVREKYSAEEVVEAFTAADEKGTLFDEGGIEAFLAAHLAGKGGLGRFRALAEASRKVPVLHALLCSPAALEAAEPWKVWAKEDGRELTRIEAGSKLAGTALDWKAVVEGVAEMLRRSRSGRHHEEWSRAVRKTAEAPGAEGRDGVWRGSISMEDSERLAAALMVGSSLELCSQRHVGAADVDKAWVRSLAKEAAEAADWTRLAFPMEGVSGVPNSRHISAEMARAPAALDALVEALADEGDVLGLEALEYWGRASIWAEDELSWRGDKYIESSSGFSEALRRLGPKLRSLIECVELDRALEARPAGGTRAAL